MSNAETTTPIESTEQPKVKRPRGRPKGSANKDPNSHPYRISVDRYNHQTDEWEFYREYDSIQDASKHLKITVPTLRNMIQGRTHFLENTYQIFHIDKEGNRREIKKPRQHDPTTEDDDNCFREVCELILNKAYTDYDRFPHLNREEFKQNVEKLGYKIKQS